MFDVILASVSLWIVYIGIKTHCRQPLFIPQFQFQFKDGVGIISNENDDNCQDNEEIAESDEDDDKELVNTNENSVDLSDFEVISDSETADDDDSTIDEKMDQHMTKALDKIKTTDDDENDKDSANKQQETVQSESEESDDEDIQLWSTPRGKGLDKFVNDATVGLSMKRRRK